MKKFFTIILALVSTTTLWAQRFQVGNLYYQVCSGKEDVIVDQYDTIGWNIPAEAITVAEARAICAELESGATTGTKYYVMGFVKKIHNNHVSGITGYGNAQFYMEDVKGANSGDDFMAFQVYGPNSKKLSDPNCVLVGDFVIIYGELANYNGTYETVGKGAAHIWKSTNPLLNEPEEPEEPEEVVILEENLGDNGVLNKFTVVNTTGDATWKYNRKGLCVQLNGTTNEDWLITPSLDLTNMSEASLIFKYKFSDIIPADNQDQYTVLVSKDFDGSEVASATWVPLSGFSYEANVYTETGAISLPAEMIGHKCHIAWRYKTQEISHTWSLKNVVVSGLTTDIAEDAAKSSISIDISPQEEQYAYVTYQTTATTNYNSLQSVEIPETVEYEGVTYNVIGIGFAAFKFSKLESITIPSSIKVVGERVFDNCSALTSVVWNIKNHADFDYKTVDTTYVYTSPFYNIRSQITSFVFGNEVEYIPAYLCCDMNNLNKITIPTTVKDIGDYALSGTGHYNDDSNWENDVLYIDNCLIRAKKTLSGDYTIKEETRLIAASALFLRQELTSVTIPNSVTNIGAHAFEGCSGLTSIISEAITPPTVGSYAFNSVNNQIPVFVPCGAVSAYRAVNSWNEFPDITEHYAQYSIVVNSQNCEMGLAEVEKNTLCGATIYATPNLGYHFVKWSDGNTENPRTLELTQDTSFTAEFAQSFSGKCGDNLYWAYNESDQSISITGSGDMYNYTSDTQPWLLLKEQIKIVTISNTVISIGQSAFAELIRLGDLYLGTKIETIAENAFANCDRLYHIYSYPTYPPFIKQSSFANYNVYLHVPCEYKEDYDLDVVWGNFKYIECLGAKIDNTLTDTVIINASSSSVTITWPTESNANTYTIVIKKGNEVFCTLKFNAEGQLLNIAFAPSRDGNNHPTQYAEQAGNGYRFTVTGLEEGTHYAYNIDVKDTANKIIKSHTGEFTTESMTAVENTYSTLSEANTQKLLRNGHLYILQDGKIYNAMGQEM